MTSQIMGAIHGRLERSEPATKFNIGSRRKNYTDKQPFLGPLTGLDESNHVF